MKRLCLIAVVLLMATALISCGSVETVETEANTDIISNDLKIGDAFTITGEVGYSEQPSDIGETYCYITTEREINYYYTDIYGEESNWKTVVFFTKENDTDILKEYIGQTVTVSGTFDSEVHGIPYITNVDVK